MSGITVDLLLRVCENGSKIALCNFSKKKCWCLALPKLLPTIHLNVNGFMNRWSWKYLCAISVFIYYSI